MKAVHVATIDSGGAYRAAVRISESMRQCGIDSKILLRTKKRTNTMGTKVFTNPLQKLISKSKNLVNLILSENGVSNDYLGTDISKHALVKDADVIVLHWVNSFISYRNMMQLLSTGKPIIWVMHDMWLLTGGCHIDSYCGRYIDGCADCPFVKSRWRKCFIAHSYHIKRNVLKKLNPVLVMPSTWMMRCASCSPATARLEKYVIPNPINEKEFYKRSCKESFLKRREFAADTKIILFGAMNATTDTNKGFQYLRDALRIADKEDWILVVFGNGNNSKLERRIGKTTVIYLGMINETSKLNRAYNIADVFAAPSKQENYANSVVEAMSCGIPVVAFNIGGMPDLISHKESGYLAEYDDVEGLIAGIDYCIENRDRLSENALTARKECNSMYIIGEKYCQLCANTVKKSENTGVVT